jgi:hypothetical protein
VGLVATCSSLLAVLAIITCVLSFSHRAWAKPKRLAVLQFRNYAALTPYEIMSITDKVRAMALRLPRDSYFILTRETILELLGPEGFAKCQNAKCELEAGRAAQSELFVSGEVGHFGKQLEVKMKLIESEAGSVLATTSATAAGIDTIREPFEAAAARLFMGLPGAPQDLRALGGGGGGGGLDGGAGAGAGTRATVGTGTVKHGVPLDRGQEIVNELVDDMGFLIIRSEPSGATLFLNGKEIGTTPKQLEKMVGKYVIVAEMGKRYHPARQELDLSTAGAEVDLELTPAFGRLRVDSTPVGAEVWLGGEQVGITPYEHEKKASGTYELRLVLKHHLTHRGQVVVKDGEETAERVTMEANYGSLEVTSEPPGALITMSGRETGDVTPHTFEVLEPGVYTVGLSLEGYGEVKERVKVTKGGRASLAPLLQAKRGLVSIMAAYEDGEMCRGKVLVDGREMGVTPLKLELTATAHEVRVVCGDGEKSERVEVGFNKKVRLDWKIGRRSSDGIDWEGEPASSRAEKTSIAVLDIGVGAGLSRGEAKSLTDEVREVASTLSGPNVVLITREVTQNLLPRGVNSCPVNLLQHALGRLRVDLAITGMASRQGSDFVVHLALVGARHIHPVERTVMARGGLAIKAAVHVAARDMLTSALGTR